MWEPFKRSVLERTSFELVECKLPSQFDGCFYGQPIYYKMLKWLVEWRVDLVNNETEIFCNAGADSEFYGDPVPDILARMVDKDMVSADDSPGVVYPRLNGPSKMCSCLQTVRPCDTVRALFSKVLEDPRIGYDTDDPILNENRGMVRWACLPHDRYHNPFNWLTPRRIWTMNDPIPDPPRTLTWFHANCCVGLESKKFLLKTVREKYVAMMDCNPKG